MYKSRLLKEQFEIIMKTIKIDISVKLPVVLVPILALAGGGTSSLLFSYTLGIDSHGPAQIAYGVTSDSIFGDVPTYTDSDDSDSNDSLQDGSKNDNDINKRSTSSDSGSNIAPQAKSGYTASNEDYYNSTVNTSPPSSSLSGTKDVSITGVNQDNSFDPNPIEISAGESVTWINHDNEIHDITSGNDGEEGMGQEFASSTLSSGKSFTHTFDKAGIYPYFCSFHESMSGEVIVK